jgi:hypothetical protein
MKIIEINLPDLSGHPAPPRMDLGTYEAWVRGDAATRTRAAMNDQEIIADFMKNEGSQTEEWPNFGEAIEVVRRQD